MEKIVSLKLPDYLVKLWKTERELTQEIKEALVLDLIRKHKITFRQGAKLLKKSYKEFLDFMFENGVPVFDYGPGELEKDLQTLEKLDEQK